MFPLCSLRLLKFFVFGAIACAYSLTLHGKTSNTVCTQRVVDDLLKERKKNRTISEPFTFEIRRKKLRQTLKQRILKETVHQKRALLHYYLLDDRYKNTLPEISSTPDSCNYLEQTKPELLQEFKKSDQESQILLKSLHVLRDDLLIQSEGPESHNLDLFRLIMITSYKTFFIEKMMIQGEWQKGSMKPDALKHKSFKFYPGKVLAETGARLPAEAALESIYRDMPILRRPAGRVLGIGTQQLDRVIFRELFSNKIGAFALINQLTQDAKPLIDRLYGQINTLAYSDLAKLIQEIGLELDEEKSDSGEFEILEDEDKRRYLLAWQMFLTYEWDMFVGEQVDRALLQLNLQDRKKKRVARLISKTAEEWVAELDKAYKGHCASTEDFYVENFEGLIRLHLVGKQIVDAESNINEPLLDEVEVLCDRRWGQVIDTKSEAILGIAGKSIYSLGFLGSAVFPPSWGLIAIGGGIEAVSMGIQSVRQFRNARLESAVINPSLKKRHLNNGHGIFLAAMAPIVSTAMVKVGRNIRDGGKGFGQLIPSFKAKGDKSAFYKASSFWVGFGTSTWSQVESYSKDETDFWKETGFWVDIFSSYVKGLGFAEFLDIANKTSTSATLGTKMHNLVKGSLISLTLSFFVNNAATDVNYLLRGSRFGIRYMQFQLTHKASLGNMDKLVAFYQIQYTNMFLAKYAPGMPLVGQDLVRVATNWVFNYIEQNGSQRSKVKFIRDKNAGYFESMKYGYLSLCHSWFGKCGFKKDKKIDDGQIEERVPVDYEFAEGRGIVNLVEAFVPNPEIFEDYIRVLDAYQKVYEQTRSEESTDEDAAVTIAL